MLNVFYYSRAPKAQLTPRLELLSLPPAGIWSDSVDLQPSPGLRRTAFLFSMYGLYRTDNNCKSWGTHVKEAGPYRPLPTPVRSFGGARHPTFSTTVVPISLTLSPPSPSRSLILHQKHFSAKKIWNSCWNFEAYFSPEERTLAENFPGKVEHKSVEIVANQFFTCFVRDYFRFCSDSVPKLPRSVEKRRRRKIK